MVDKNQLAQKFRASLTHACPYQDCEATIFYDKIGDIVTPEQYVCPSRLAGETASHCGNSKIPRSQPRICGVYSQFRREVYFGLRNPSEEELREFESKFGNPVIGSEKKVLTTILTTRPPN